MEIVPDALFTLQNSERRIQMRIEEIKLWPDREDVTLKAYITPVGDNIPGWRPSEIEKAPAIVICQGGAYRNLQTPEGDAFAAHFASKGYQSFVLAYSVEMNCPKGKSLFPNQLLDFGKAWLKIREHADEWNVDVDRISIMGFSAGGNLVGMYGTTWHHDLLADTFHVEKDVFKPLCAISLYGVMDYRIQAKAIMAEEAPFIHEELPRCFGTMEPTQEQLEQYSPICNVDEHTVPMFLANAQDDPCVPAVESLLMAQKLMENNIFVEYHLFPTGGHAFAFGRDALQPYRQDKLHQCSKWLELVERFLLYMNVPEAKQSEGGMRPPEE
jgi:acetyl esterase/lipase